jgi:hypothetical protein
VALLGGGGYFGTRLLARLRAEMPDAWLIASTTTPGRDDELRARGASAVAVWDGSDSEVLRGALTCAENVVISLRYPVHGPDALTAALKAAAAYLSADQRVIQISTIQAELPGTPFGSFEALLDGAPRRAVVRIGQLVGPGADARGASRNLRGHYEKVVTFTGGRLHGDGSQPVHVTHVDDLVDATVALLRCELTGTFNVVETLPLDQRRFHAAMAAHFDRPDIHWLGNGPGAGNLLLPPTVSTTRLYEIPGYTRQRSRYALEALLAL